MNSRTSRARRACLFGAAALLICSAVPADAQDVASDPPAPAATSPLAIRWNVEVIGAGRFVEPASTPINPGNRVLQLPETIGILDVRGNLRVEAGSRVSLILRPRVSASVEHVTPSATPSNTEGDADAQFTEAYAAWRPLDALALTYGLQNFQWGPAELVSPSNRVFHETGVFRDPLYSVRGKHLVRANVSAGRQWSLVALAELSHNGAGADEAFQAGIPFSRQALAKLEFADAGGGTYVGATLGVVDGARPWFGEYGMWTISDALAFYLDASHARGSGAWYPATWPVAAPSFERTLRDSDDWKTMAVLGARYTFARGDELRLEYFHQDAGYGDGQMRDAVTTVLLAQDREQFTRFLAPGLEFLGRDLALVSLRLPDLPPAKRINVQARYLASVTDGSGVVFTTMTLNATDAMVAFVSAAVTHGPTHAEFSRLVAAFVTVGVVYAF